MSFRLAELAEHVGAQLVGDPDLQIDRARSLESAGPRDISFLTGSSYLSAARCSAAGAMVVPVGALGIECAQLVCEKPATAMVELLALLHPLPREQPGIHPSAVIAESAEVSSSASIGPFVVVGERSQIGDGTRLDAHVVIGRDCRLGSSCWLQPHVTLYDGTILGDEVVIQASAVVGAAGHGFIRDEHGYRRVPQIGIVELGDRVEIGANAAIDRATLEKTSIGAGTKIDNLVQVGHNVEIGPDGMVCGQAGLAGSSKIGRGVVIAGQAGISDHLVIGDGVKLGAAASLLQDAPAGAVMGGSPAIEYSKWRRQTVVLKRIEDLYRRLVRLEKTIGSTEEGES